MAVAQGSCPGCGADIEFSVGSSLAKVCGFCSTTVVRSDRGLENLGKVAELAQTPCLIAVGDEGTLGGRPFTVVGRLQLDHGAGPWDEFYVSLDHGNSWGWLAYAEGQWYCTVPTPGVALPPIDHLTLEADVPIGGTNYRVREIKNSRVLSAEGELPIPTTVGQTSRYVDCYAAGNLFATLDYGDGLGAYSVYTGYIFPESQLSVSALGPRHAEVVDTGHIQCPHCGGDVPKLAGQRSERMGCPYCHTVSDIATRQIVAQQDSAYASSEVPVGSRGEIDGVEYIVIARLVRGAMFDGEDYTWEEYLLWSQGLGFRWLVKDEGNWLWVMPANLAEIQYAPGGQSVSWGGKTFSRRAGETLATVRYVLGEVYWKCEIGESTHSIDFVAGNEILSREATSEEVSWSYSTPIAWAMIASAFGLGGSVAQAGASTANAEDAEPGVKPKRGMREHSLLALGGLGLIAAYCNTCGGCAAPGASRPTKSAHGYKSPGVAFIPSSRRSVSSSRSSTSGGSRSGSGSYSGGK